MLINARNLAAALAYEGADVEAALLELVSGAPSLDAKVRRALYHDTAPTKLIFVQDRQESGYKFVHHHQPRWVCVMHAIDAITQFIADSDIKRYLETRFSEYASKLQRRIA